MQNSTKIAVRVLAAVMALVLVLGLVAMAANAQEDGAVCAMSAEGLVTSYESLDAALEAADETVTYYQLAGDVTGGTIDQDILLDLNGHNVSEVTVNAGVTVRLMDSANDEYDASKCGSFSGTVNGTVEQLVKTTADEVGEVKSYLVINQDGVYSAHRYYAGITKINLVPGSVALGYKAEYYADEVINEMVTGYGYELWVNELNPVQRVKEGNITDHELTLRLKNILVEGNDTLSNVGVSANIQGRAFINFSVGKASGADHSTTLQAAVEAVNTSLGQDRSAYTKDQIQSMRDLINKFNSYMNTWEQEYIFTEDKFAPVENVSATYGENLTLGQVFTAVEGMTIGENVTVTVNGEEIIASENWADTALNLNAGEAVITITDNERCWTAANTVAVAKADPTYTIPTGLTAEVGQTLTDVELSEGFDWSDPSQTIDTIGVQSFAAVYDSGDSNYNTAEVSVNVTVKDHTIIEQPIPTAGYPEGQVFTLGELFEAADGYEIDSARVTATVNDEELTVNTSDWTATEICLEKAGVYEVEIFGGEYCLGASISLTVEAKQDKFVAKAVDPVVFGDSLTLGDLFEGTGINSKVTYTVNGQTYTIIPNPTTANKWAATEITFDAVGTYEITIVESILCNVATNTVTVVKADPSYTVPTGLTATYGQTLNDVALTDNWTWKDSGASVGNAGTNSFTAVYTPADTANYNTVEVAVSVAVAKANPAYTVPTGLTAIEGDALSTIILEGGFAWKNASEIVALDKAEYAATFTPSDTANYNIVDVNIPVAVSEKVKTAVDKFAISLYEGEPAFLYRVGNVNAVKLGSLFKALDNADVGTVSVEIETLGGNVTGVYTANATWTDGTIKFTNTGVVKVTISDETDDTIGNPVTITLEVIDATNVTAYSELKNQNSVLLNDITMSSGGSFYLSGGNTLYGNGFTLDMSQGTHAAGGSTSASYVFGLDNSNLDNVRIVGEVYTQYGAQVSNEYNRAAVLSVGNCTITNSYISNCASAVRVKDGNLEIINSTIKGGNFANIDIRGGNVVLDNVTTINQVNGNDTAEDGTIVVGLGVVVYYENVLNTTTVTVKNGITQYNVISEDQYQTYLKDSNAQTLMKKVFTITEVIYKDGTDKWVNTGILSMTADTVADANISDVDGYIHATASLTGINGYVHTKVPVAADTTASAPAYVSAGQGPIAPTYSFDFAEKNYVANDGTNDYCVYNYGTVSLSMDAGDTFNWDTSILTATKFGTTLDYTVTMNGTDYTGKSIAFSEAGAYQVVYTYTDSNNYAMDADGNVTTYSKVYTKTVHISVAVVEAAAKHAEFTMGSSNAATEKITVDNVNYVSATGVTADNSTWTYMTIGGQKIYYPIIAAKLTSTKGSSTYAYFPVFENAVTITDYEDGGLGDAFTYNSSTTTLPSALTAVKGIYKAASDVPYWYNLTNSDLTKSGATNIFKWASSSSAPSDPTTYSNVLCYKSPQVSADRVAYITLVQYSYTDSTNTTYYYYVGYTLEAFTKQSTCFTADTLITMADGTQKEVQYVSAEELIQVWDFYTGEYTVVPAGYVMDHGYGENVEIKLDFADGTTVKVVNEHGFFDVASNEFVFINESNVDDYLGHSFAKQSGEGFESVELISYTVTTGYMESWSILSYGHYNCLAEGMLALTAHEAEGNFFMPFEVGADMKFDEAKMLADIETYGVYTYEEFADVMSKELFDALNMPYVKVAVGKGITSEEDIWYLLNLHFGIER